MWKYTHTDEMYHSLTNKNELFHSDTYLGQDFSDGVRHFKYIKREKVNGKWRYYYKDDKLNALAKKNETNRAAITYENKKRGYGNSSGIYFKAKGKDVNDPTYNKLADDVWESQFKYGRAKKKSDKRKKIYDKTAIKALNAVSNASYKGKKAIQKQLNKLKKKKKK